MKLKIRTVGNENSNRRKRQGVILVGIFKVANTIRRALLELTHPSQANGVFATNKGKKAGSLTTILIILLIVLIVIWLRQNGYI